MHLLVMAAKGIRQKKKRKKLLHLAQFFTMDQTVLFIQVYLLLMKKALTDNTREDIFVLISTIFQD